MKKLLVLFILFYCGHCDAQQLINGDFENHSYEECTYNLSDEDFNLNVPDVFAFGKAFIQGENIGELDLQTFECYVEPESGDWCVGLSADESSFSDALSMALTSSLDPGEKYEISFSHYSNSENAMPIEIGASQTEDDFGILLGTYTPTFEKWSTSLISFTASENSKYITVRAVPGDFGWTQVDAFSIQPMGTPINEHELSQTNIYPNPVSDFLNIDLSKSPKLLDLSVKDVLGRSFINNEYSNVDQIKLNLSKLDKGVYILELQHGVERHSLPIIKL